MSGRSLRVLVTGANGGLGRPVRDALEAIGHEVRATDLRRNRGDVRPLEVVNLLDREACYRLVRGVDAVVHLGNHPNDLLTDAQRLLMDNVAMTTHVIQAAIDEGVEKVVFASSVQVISGESGGPGGPRRNSGESAGGCSLPYLPADGAIPARPGNPYALSKQMGEDLLAYAARIAGMQCIAIRFPWLMREPVHVFRERARQWEHGLDPRLINEAASYLTMSDAAELIVQILAVELPGFRVYFPASPEPLTGTPIEELLDRAYAGVPLRVPRAELTGLVDVSAITAETGWTPTG